MEGGSRSCCPDLEHPPQASWAGSEVNQCLYNLKHCQSDILLFIAKHCLPDINKCNGFKDTEPLMWPRSHSCGHLQAAHPPSASWYPMQTRQRVGRFDCRSRARQLAQDPGSSQLQASGLRTLGWPHCSIQGFPRGLSMPAAHALACALWGSFWSRRAVSEMRQVGRTPSKQRKSEIRKRETTA